MTKGRWLLFLFLTLAVVSLGLTSPGKVEIFNSPLSMKVFVRVSPEIPDRVLGFTPVAKGHRIRINPGTFWYVRPSGSLNGHKLDRLARDIRHYGIPGLDISDHWELTDASLLHLRELPSLRLLDLSRTRLSNASANSVATLQGLRIFAAPEALNDHGLAALKKIHLRDLSLDKTRVTDEGMRLLPAHPSLESLDLSETAVTDQGLVYLKGLPNLKKLVIGGRITDAGTPSLQAIKSLQQLDISQTQITDKGLGALATLPNLKSVYLSRSIGDKGLEQLSTSRSLESLDLSGAAITDEGIRSLSKIQSLKELDISQTPIDDKGMEALSKLPNLRMLELSDTHVTNAGLGSLTKLKHLEILSLSWQKLTRNDLHAMAQLPQVKTIVLNGVPLPDATMNELHRFNHASPWSHPQGFESADLAATPPENTALIAPISASKAVQPSVALPGSAHSLTSPLNTFHPAPITPNPTGMPATLPMGSNPRLLSEKTPHGGPNGVDALQSVSAPETLASAPKKSSSENVLTPQPLKDNSHYTMGSAPVAGRTPAPEDITVAEGKSATPSKKASEDTLLQTIALQSSPSKHGGFSGLTGMRQIRLAQNNSGLTDMDNGAQAKIKMQEDTPENSVGEIEVGARH